MATILGISFFYHDSASALVRDGEIISASAEERFTRKKHTAEFPKHAIAHCLKAGGLSSINEVDAVVFYEKPVRKFMRIVEGVVQTWPRSLSVFTGKFPEYLTTKMNIYRVITRELPGYQGRILFSEHHLSHAASAFYCSPFDSAAIVTVDGVGEYETTAIGRGHNGTIELSKAIHYPHSIGLLYSALTSYLGFRVNDAEWKVMGLAPYGRPTYAEQFRKLVSMYEDGSFQLNLEYFSHHYSSRNSANVKAWHRLFGFPQRKEGHEIEDRHRDLAHSGQLVVEELMLNLAKAAKTQYPEARYLVIGGGVGLNSVANWKIQKSGLFSDVWIQPAAGDDGGAIGAALVASINLFQDPRRCQMEHAYLGPDYSEAEMQSLFEEQGIRCEKLSDEDVVKKTATLLAEEKIVGWFQGRMEFGPRSLGARSILASSASLDMKEKVNRTVKFRESFRPFAPAVPLENVSEYFNVGPGTKLPFMLKVPDVLEDKKQLIPAVTHVDGTARVQTVTEKENPRFHRLLKEFGRQTGVPVLLNTSFNVRGEPIVCTPRDALDCFNRTDINALVMGSFLITEKIAAPMNPEEGYGLSDSLERGDSRVSSQSNEVDSDNAAVMGAGSTVKNRVRSFYKKLPFNDYSNAIDFANNLMRSNRIREYRPLHAHLRSGTSLKVLDVGSGAGWFVNSCAYFYNHQVTGVEFNPVATEHARSAAIFMPGGENASYVVDDLFQFNPTSSFDVVNSLGVLHHTENCHKAVHRVCQWVRPGGYLHLGLYHRYGRTPFLNHFSRMREAGATYAELLEAFKELFPAGADDVHLVSWFRDQVLHPHESQHTYEEILPILVANHFEVELTSINGYKKISSHSEIARQERELEEVSRKAIARKKYFPGFFVIWARKKVHETEKEHHEIKCRKAG